MRIKIISFKVTERYVLRDSFSLRKWLFRLIEPNQYHYDTVIRIQPTAMELQDNDIIELPNRVKLIVWRISRDILRAKTLKFTDKKLQGYAPLFAYLVYSKQHGHISDRA